MIFTKSHQRHKTRTTSKLQIVTAKGDNIETCLAHDHYNITLYSDCMPHMLYSAGNAPRVFSLPWLSAHTTIDGLLLSVQAQPTTHSQGARSLVPTADMDRRMAEQTRHKVSIQCGQRHLACSAHKTRAATRANCTYAQQLSYANINVVVSDAARIAQDHDYTLHMMLLAPRKPRSWR